MKSSKRWVFIVTLSVWTLLLGLMIYAIVYAPLGSWPKNYAFIIGLFFITFTQVVKRAYRYSYRTERRIRK
ncbi:hypothetical protein FLAN108750_10655 [Flavobacterium antarcticum]|uniref:hypothetical protein n=1 Tax=Flavobacterium antarcticum TaxID=271155 RepID=UPI0003B5A5A5|nr:hypothetical protein [Flavobacterium antarcticum]